MTLTALNAVISNDRRNLDRAAFVRDCKVIQASREFMDFVEKAVAIGVAEGLFAPAAATLVRTAMVTCLQTGYKVRDQEIGASELEAFFGTTDEIPQQLRIEENPAAAQQAVQDLQATGE